MAKQIIFLGQTPNDRTGDPLRVAFEKVNANFDELYAGGASENRLTNGVHELVLNVNGTTPYVTFPAVNGDYTVIQGGEISAFGNNIDISSAFDSVMLSANATGTNGPTKDWTFGTDGSLAYPNGALQRDTTTVTCPGNASTVVFTATGVSVHTIRLLIQVEGDEGASVNWDTQSCEMIIAKSIRGDDIASSVHGIVYTSVAPLATFTALWNALTSRIEVLCTTPSANMVSVRIFATEITTAD